MKADYREAMKVRTQDEANKFFECLVQSCMEKRQCERKEAEEIQRLNLGYFAGYYGEDVRARVERLYRCAHPIFGPIADNGSPTPEHAFWLGYQKAKSLQ